MALALLVWAAVIIVAFIVSLVGAKA